MHICPHICTYACIYASGHGGAGCGKIVNGRFDESVYGVGRVFFCWPIGGAGCGRCRQKIRLGYWLWCRYGELCSGQWDMAELVVERLWTKDSMRVLAVVWVEGILRR